MACSWCVFMIYFKVGLYRVFSLFCRDFLLSISIIFCKCTCVQFHDIETNVAAVDLHWFAAILALRIHIQWTCMSLQSRPASTLPTVLQTSFQHSTLSDVNRRSLATARRSGVIFCHLGISHESNFGVYHWQSDNQYTTTATTTTVTATNTANWLLQHLLPW